MKKFLIVFLLLFAWLSCKKVEPLCGCSPVSYGFFLSVQDKNGRDVLSSFHKDSIRVTEIINGKERSSSVIYGDKYLLASNGQKFDGLILPSVIEHKRSEKTDYVLIRLSTGSQPDTLRFDLDNMVPRNVTINSQPAVFFLSMDAHAPIYVLQK